MNPYFCTCVYSNCVFIDSYKMGGCSVTGLHVIFWLYTVSYSEVIQRLSVLHPVKNNKHYGLSGSTNSLQCFPELSNTWFNVKVRLLIRGGFDLFLATGIKAFAILTSYGQGSEGNKADSHDRGSPQTAGTALCLNGATYLLG